MTLTLETITSGLKHSNIKPIALYLPQFHPIPENDKWWGKGFTEWTNVAAARSKFKGHYQPHIPADLGFYDLRLPEVLMQQAELAKQYGIYGFCFYHYWFNGDLLLEKPLEILFQTQTINLPFCLCWANENWTRRWDGRENEILKQQNYNRDDDLKHIRYLLKFFKDDRYIKIDGKPVFLMYRTELHPDIKEGAEIWRQEARKEGFPDLFLIRVENFQKNQDPAPFNFDAGMEFAPDNFALGKNTPNTNPILYTLARKAHKYGLYKNEYFDNHIFLYQDLIKQTLEKPDVSYTYFRTICPSWDNSPRRQKGATIFKDASPDLFRAWFEEIVTRTAKNLPANKQLIFINAWNEWGEGCHLEPDKKWGRQYLEAIEDVLKGR